jgi:hypothetical protein
VYRRYLSEKLGLSYAVNRHLHTLLSQIIAESRWDMIYLGMQIMVEGLALAVFGLMRFTAANEPLIQQNTSYVMRDEARHVAFGVLSLQDLYIKEMTSTELKEREEFGIGATMLMRDRLLMEEIWPRLDLDPAIWMPWSMPQRQDPEDQVHRERLPQPRELQDGDLLPLRRTRSLPHTESGRPAKSI